MENMHTVHHEQNRLNTGNSQQPVTKKRLAAYCRVSTLQEEQDLSYEAQQKYYKTVFKDRQDCELVGIYGDEGISGRLAAKRPGFLKMIQDCRNGKIDEIHTRSISRFARNYAECVEYIRELHGLGITVYFEKENLKTDEKNVEMMLSIMAIISQEESNSISQNITLAEMYRNKLGDPIRRAAYGYIIDTKANNGVHEWHIHEEQAIRVRMVFSLFLLGFPRTKIAEQLQCYEAQHGFTKTWNARNITYMLKNEVYIGDLLTCKTYTVDYLNSSRKINSGEKEQQYLKDHHPAIISRSDFIKVQKLLGREIPVWLKQ